MNSTLKNDILTSYRAGTTDFEILARHYGCSPAQAEKVVFPNGRFKKVLPFAVPKVAKVVTTGTFNGETVRVAEIHVLKPRLEKPVMSTPVKVELWTPPATTATKSKAQSPQGRLGALKAWETMREQQAKKKGEIYIRKTDEELRKLAGFIDEKIEEEPIVKVKPEAVEARVKQLEAEGRQAEADRIRKRLTRHKDEELYVDSARIVETGRAVVAYCDHKNITPEQLIEAYEQLVAINKLLGK
jgi:hypothetical protein